MTLEQLLNYVDEHARDVADKAAVSDIRRIQPGDPWRKTLIADIRGKYEAEAETAERMKDFD